MTDREFLDLAIAQLNRLTRYGRRLCGDADRADDLAQDVIIRALDRRNELRDGGQIVPWLFRILRNRYLEEVRGSKRRLTLLETGAVALEVPAPDLEREILAADLSDEVDGALRALPEEQRSAVLLVDVEGLSYEEAAQVLEIPIGTVRSRIARARARLLESLASIARQRGIGLGRQSP